nr:hepatoma-derived growth factor-related protein 2-like [Dermacentor andersoni]
MSEHYSDCRTQVQRKLQGPVVSADVHQQQLPLWCRALQLLLGQVGLHVKQPPTLQQPPSQPTPQPTPREPQAPPPPPRRQSRQQDLEGAVQMATAEYVPQGQLAEARRQEEARFRRQMLEQNQRHHEAHMKVLRQQHTGHMEGLQQLREEVGNMRDVQQQRLAVERRSQETNQRPLQLLLAALAHSGGLVPPPSQAPHI